MLSWTLYFSAAAFANGSSGVGTASIPITDGIAASNLNGRVKVSGSQIVDASGGAPLVDISKISSAEIASLSAASRLVPARLGTVSGYEFTPDIRDSRSSNYWVVCDKDPESCKKLSPLSDSALIPELIGTLIEN